MKIKVVDIEGQETGSVEFQDRPKVNPSAVKLAYQAYLNSLRSAQAKVKKRGEVRGGGKKPWRQKGTGRARIGSSRAPHWIGGGQVFGPTGRENYKLYLNNKYRKSAISDALFLKAKAGRMVILDGLGELKKTKEAKALIEKLNKEKNYKNICLVVSGKPPIAFRNLTGITAVATTNLTIKHIIDADLLVFAGEAKKVLERTR